MILAYMLNMSEDLLKCDMAETYHLYITDWYDPPFPISYLADLAAGLSENSRIKRKITGQKLTTEQSLSAIMIDKLAILIWQQTKDGHKGRNLPESVYRRLSGLYEKKKEELQAFKTIEDYEKWFKGKQHV